MAADLDDVVIELKKISEALVWYNDGTAMQMLLESLREINNTLSSIEIEIKSYRQLQQ